MIINVCREPVSSQVELLTAVVMKCSVFLDVHGDIFQNRELFGFQSSALNKCGRHFTFQIYRRIDIDTCLRIQKARGWMKVQYFVYFVYKNKINLQLFSVH